MSSPKARDEYIRLLRMKEKSKTATDLEPMIADVAQRY